MRSPCRERDQRFQKRISARWSRAQNRGRDLCTENATNVFKSGFPHVGRERKIVDAISVQRTRPTFSNADFRFVGLRRSNMVKLRLRPSVIPRLETNEKKKKVLPTDVDPD